MRKTYFLDFTEFDKGFDVFAAKYMDAAEGGMREAIQELKIDSDTIVPRTPHLHGDLRGQYKFEFMVKMAQLVGVIIYEMPYAARWHEAVGMAIQWSEKGSGPKYIESKMILFKKKYIGIIAGKMREVTK